MTKSKDLIIKLREVQKEKKISYDKILSLMEQDGQFSSKSTLSRLFGDNWEKYSFDYENTLIPIANVLLDVENIEEDDDTETKAFKSLLKLKMSVIDDNARQIAELTDREREEMLTAGYQAYEKLNVKFTIKDNVVFTDQMEAWRKETKKNVEANRKKAAKQKKI